MDKIHINPFRIAGLTARVSNDQPESIVATWGEFWSNDIGNAITSKESMDIHCVYHSYEGDHRAPYLMTIGYRVPADYVVSGELSVVTVPAQIVAQFEAVGALPDALISQWQKIWTSDLDRAYRADFDVYDATRSDRASIYVGLK
ncbi:GyrI-like domain-containing protein [Brucella pituitosa]|uniref:GyrI-like domain-containing protein n=1 Tax=Brucella pituitosa TaxID=571256 RepID=UPI0009A20D0D|nr:effector binding domain-containing protein [Brucella pituitosa]